MEGRASGPETSGRREKIAMEPSKVIFRARETDFSESVEIADRGICV
jgi:hypothetical protein